MSNPSPTGRLLSEASPEALVARHQKVETQPRSTPITIASVLFFVWGLVSGLATLQILIFLIETHAFPVFNGVQMFDSGYFEGVELWLMIGKTAAVLAACGLQIVAAVWLWKSLKRGGRLGFVLLALGLFITITMAAPGLLIARIPGALLIARGWGSLR